MDLVDTASLALSISKDGHDFEIIVVRSILGQNEVLAIAEHVIKLTGEYSGEATLHLHHLKIVRTLFSFNNLKAEEKG